jgi:hypothetical protein
MPSFTFTIIPSGVLGGKMKIAELIPGKMQKNSISFAFHV